jgi:DNA polymerase V
MEVENFLTSNCVGTKKVNQQDTRFKASRFGGGADDMEIGIDLNEHLVANKAATCFLKVTSNSMVDAGIFNGDIVIVDNSIKPANGKIVIAILDGEMLIRKYERTINRLRLIPETARLSPIEISEFMDCQISGVVTYVIRAV